VTGFSEPTKPNPSPPSKINWREISLLAPGIIFSCVGFFYFMKNFDSHAPNLALFLLFVPGCVLIVLSYFANHDLPSFDPGTLIFIATLTVGGFFIYAGIHEKDNEQSSREILVGSMLLSFAGGIKVGNEFPRPRNHSKKRRDADE